MNTTLATIFTSLPPDRQQYEAELRHQRKRIADLERQVQALQSDVARERYQALLRLRGARLYVPQVVDADEWQVVEEHGVRCCCSACYGRLLIGVEGLRS